MKIDNNLKYCYCYNDMVSWAALFINKLILTPSKYDFSHQDFLYGTLLFQTTAHYDIHKSYGKHLLVFS